MANQIVEPIIRLSIAMLLRPQPDIKTSSPLTRHRRAVIAAGLIVAAVLAGGLVYVHDYVGRNQRLHWARTIPPFIGEMSVTKPRGQNYVRAADAAQSLAAIDLGAIREGDEPVSAVYLAKVPDDLLNYATPRDRREMFLQIMLPLVLKVNAGIGTLRNQLEAIRTRQEDGLAREDTDFLARLGEMYGVEEGDIDALLLRVDAIPPSLAMAQALEESGWGKSRFARVANALFGQHAFRSDRPQVPHPLEGVPPIRAFPDLISSISAYMHNLNTHRAYADFRAKRGEMRAAGKTADSMALAATLLKYSERGEDYTANIQAHIDAHKLWQFDTAELDD